MIIYVNQKFSHLHQDFLTHKGQTEVKSQGNGTLAHLILFFYTLFIYSLNGCLRCGTH